MNSSGDEQDPELGRKVIPLPGLRLPPAQVEVHGRDSDGDIEAPEPFGPCPPEPAQLAAAAEAVLFTAADPIALAQLDALLDQPGEEALRAALALIQVRYQRGGHGLRLVEVAGGWQLRTQPAFARWCARARDVRPVRLSRAALETLAIVAYEQPVTRAEVEQIRGVDPGAILRSLVERGLVRSTGHREEPGHPLTYGTTPAFLELFGLRDLSDLPSLRDLRELKDDGPEEPSDGDLGESALDGGEACPDQVPVEGPEQAHEVPAGADGDPEPLEP